LPTPTPEPTIPPWTNPFTDVNEGDWFYDAVKYVNQSGLFSGVSETSFGPNGAMTRAMFATVLHRMDNGQFTVDDDSIPKAFSDVPEGAWYYDAVLWAADKGIVSGVGDGRFDPNAPVTREQMAAMLWSYIRYKEYVLKASINGADFADEAMISDWARDAVKNIKQIGIITGRPGNIFDQQGIATRAEVETIFQRLTEAPG